ncbi:MAG: hypothetical protein LUD39_01225 [Opitutae bacterium]|nr:hypothetical protein [Opitutae bacterium]
MKSCTRGCFSLIALLLFSLLPYQILPISFFGDKCYLTSRYYVLGFYESVPPMFQLREQFPFGFYDEPVFSAEIEKIGLLDDKLYVKTKSDEDVYVLNMKTDAISIAGEWSLPLEAPEAFYREHFTSILWGLVYFPLWILAYLLFALRRKIISIFKSGQKTEPAGVGQK